MKTLLTLFFLCLAVTAWAEDKDTMYWEWIPGEFSYKIDTILTERLCLCNDKWMGWYHLDIDLDMIHKNCGNWQRRPDRWTYRVDTTWEDYWLELKFNKDSSLTSQIVPTKLLFDTTWIPLCPVFMDTTKQHRGDGLNWDSLEFEMDKAIKRVIEKMKGK